MSQYKLSERYNYSDYLFPHGTVNGVAVPFYTTPEFRDEVREKFKLRKDDIFVVTYPKSGTTWLQGIKNLIEENFKDKTGPLTTNNIIRLLES